MPRIMANDLKRQKKIKIQTSELAKLLRLCYYLSKHHPYSELEINLSISESSFLKWSSG